MNSGNILSLNWKFIDISLTDNESLMGIIYSERQPFVLSKL